jgi:uncharacterized membrane protein YfcA
VPTSKFIGMPPTHSLRPYFSVPIELLAALAVAIGAFAQAVTGIGFALVCAPLLVMSIDPRQGLSLTNFIGILLSLLVLSREWRQANVKHAAALLVPACIVSVPAALLIRRIDPDQASVVAGALILFAVALLASGFRTKHLHGKSGIVGAGTISGIMSMLAGVGGPAVALYAVNASWDIKTLRPTLNVYFIGLSAVAIAMRGVPEVSAGFASTLVVAMVAGFAGGIHLAKRLSADHIRTMILVIASAGGVAAIVKGTL